MLHRQRFVWFDRFGSEDMVFPERQRPLVPVSEVPGVQLEARRCADGVWRVLECQEIHYLGHHKPA